MSDRGTVRQWHGAEGWGVIDSPTVPGGCWVSFTALKFEPRDLDEGQQVEFECESAEQDGYRYRAVRVWLAGTQPIEPRIRQMDRGMTTAAWDIDPSTGQWRRIDE
ncbi:cold-shock protein [Nocardia brasiliensis]|uniref:cold-shock protein n=1 Tax=Nocardia brasiliensis TaxID=37326 RepID=UPI0037A5144D